MGLRWPSLSLPLGAARRLAISIEGTEVRVLVFAGRQVIGWYQTTLPARAVRNGFLVAGGGGGQHLRGVLARAGLTRLPLVVAFPGVQSFTRVLQIPLALRANLDTLVQREARRLLAVSLENSYVFWQALTTSGRETFRRVYLVVVPREPLLATLEALTGAGLKVAALDLKPLAVARAVNVPEAIIAHGDLHGGDVIVVVGGVPTLIRSFYWSDEPLAPEYAAIRLTEELTRTISFYNDSNRDSPLALDVPIYLTGALAEDPALAPTIAGVTSRQVPEVLSPLRCPPDLPARAFMAVFGMVLKRP